MPQRLTRVFPLRSLRSLGPAGTPLRRAAARLRGVGKTWNVRRHRSFTLKQVPALPKGGVLDHVAGGLAPLFGAAGYRRTARVWRRQIGEAICITRLQGSDANTAERGKFTLNLGVYFPDADVLQHGPPPIAHPTEADTAVWERIGMLMPVVQDVWWTADGSHVLEVVAEIASAWSEFGQPWLDQHADMARAQAFLESRQQFYEAAAFALLRGQKDDAGSLVQRSMAVLLPRRPDMARWQQQWAAKHGLQVGEPKQRTDGV